MKNSCTFSAILTLAVLIAGCAGKTKDIHVESQLAPGVDLGAYKTYGWQWIEEEVHDPYGLWINSDMDVAGEVAWLIEREMKNRGFTMAKENPDVFIVFQFAVDMESLAVVKRNTAPNGLRIETVPQGAIIVTLIDGKSGIPFWYGYADGEIKNSDPELGKKRISFAITNIFKTLK